MHLSCGSSPRNGTDFFAINLDDSGLTNAPDDPGFYEEALTVSPSGEKIVYSCYDWSGEPDVFVMRADGTGVRQVTDTSRAFEWGPDWQPLVP